MMSRPFERLAVLIILLVAIVLRVWDLPRLPLGFSAEELTTIDITRQIRDGTARVFFEVAPEGGSPILYPAINTTVSNWAGDGLLGYRLLSLWANLLALAFLYWGARQLFGRSIGLLSLAIMSTSMAAVMVSRMVTGDTLVPFFATATLAGIVWAFRLYEPIAPRTPSTYSFTLLGFLIGLSIYAHYVGLLLFIILIIFMVYLYWTRQPVSRLMWSSSFFVVTLVLVIALPYIISLLRNPHLSPLAIFWQERPTSLGDFFNSLASTFLGMFIEGDALPSHNVPSLPLLSPVWFVLVIVGLTYLLRRWREPGFGLVLIFIAIGLIPDIWIVGDVDFTHLSILQPIFFILASLGTYVTARIIQDSPTLERLGGWRIVAVLAGVAILFTTYQTYQRYLVEWSDREDVQAAYQAQLAELTLYLDTHPDTKNTPTLFCVDNLFDDTLPSGNIRWSEPQIIEYMLHREGYNLRYAICRSGLVFADGGQQMRVLIANPRTVSEAAPPIRVWFDYLQPIEPNLPVFSIAVVDEIAQLGGQLQLNAQLAYPLESGSDAPLQLPVRFGRNITLLGYEPPNLVTPYHPLEPLVITTYWRVDGEPPSALGIFTRLHDTPQASPYTETNVLDVLPANLQERDVIIQTSFMAIPANLPDGEYVITIGAYDNNPLNQIAVFGDQADQERGTYLIIQPRITVEANGE